jgi:hypothetical protein
MSNKFSISIAKTVKFGLVFSGANEEDPSLAELILPWAFAAVCPTLYYLNYYDGMVIGAL